MNAVRVRGYPGIAFYVVAEGCGENDQVIVVMVGDDRRRTVKRRDVTPLADDAFCSECGQIGCCHGN